MNVEIIPHSVVQPKTCKSTYRVLYLAENSRIIINIDMDKQIKLAERLLAFHTPQYAISHWSVIVPFRFILISNLPHS